MMAKTIVCENCNNVNYAEGIKSNECVRCNWINYDKWDGVMYNVAVGDPAWRGFGWKCLVCENHNAGEFDDHDICPSCGWQQDTIMENDPGYWGGPNWLTLNEAKENYKTIGQIMTEKDEIEQKAFYAAHKAPDGKWIDNCGRESCRCQTQSAKDK